jgi:4-amino-4-deoxy-L-arabinose transferase-like glycosyltransferase
MKAIAWLAAGVVFLIHAFGNARSEFFRDELYFIICGRHPQWGYVDQPPIVPLLAAATQIFGHSVFLLRLVPAFFAAAGVFTTCLLASEFGGGIFAQVLASMAFLFAGVLLGFGQIAAPDEVGLWTWPLLALLIVRIIKGADPRLWLVVGLVAGFSIQSKYTVLFLLASFVAGLLLTPERRIMRNAWFAAGCGVSLVIALPNFVWQAHYGFPMWELLRAGQTGKNAVSSPPLFLFQQALTTNLFLSPIWMIGLAWFLRRGPYRFLGYAYIALIVQMLFLHAKYYYPADVYPILIAAGAMQIEAWTSQLRVFRTVVLAYALVLGGIFVPYTLAILPERAFLAYQQRLIAVQFTRTARASEQAGDVPSLPGVWADMHGWQQFAATVKGIYESLPPAQRAQAVVVASNFGEASAIEFYTPGVPVISYHNQYWLWGTHGYTGDVTIDISGATERLFHKWGALSHRKTGVIADFGDCGPQEHLFTSAQLVTHFNVPYTLDWETDIPIMVCRGIRIPLATLWPNLKEYF